MRYLLIVLPGVIILLASTALLSWYLTQRAIRKGFLRMIANGLIPVLRELKEHTNLGEPDLTRISLEGQLQAVARIIQTLYNPYEGFMVLDDLLPEPERLTWRDFFSRQTDHSGWGE